MQLSKGMYKTRDGHFAVVARVKSHSGNQWIVQGAIGCLHNVLALQEWSLDGKSFADPSGGQDLVERLSE